MNLKESRVLRRLGVTFTITGLLLFAFLFEVGRYSRWTGSIIIPVVVSFLLSFLFLYFTYVNTGLWGFSHKKLEEYDERELVIVSSAARVAYVLFTITVLLVILVYAAWEIRMSMIVVFVLGVLAHLLPQSVIAWQEKKIY